MGKCQFDGNQTTNQLNIQTQPREENPPPRLGIRNIGSNFFAPWDSPRDTWKMVEMAVEIRQK